MSRPRPLWLRAASGVYRLCVRLTPRAFRERFGWESEDTFRHLVEDTLRRKGSGAAMTTAAAACGDLARTGVAERASGWRAVASGAGSDLTQSLRIYSREPLLASAIAVILALIAGPAVAIFSALYNIVLAPLPYPEADRLVVIAHKTPTGFNPYLRAFSVSDYRAVDAFSMVGGVFPVTELVTLKGAPERVQSFRTTSGLLTGLGVPFAAGRDLQRGEPEVVVTRGFAIARFGSEAAAVGAPILLRSRQMTIVGVVAYRPPLPGPPGAGADLFVPHVNADTPSPSRERSMGQAIVIAKVKRTVNDATALHQTRALAAALQKQFGGPDATPELVPLGTAISGSLRVPMLILFATVAVVFLIGATSVASLVLARAASRATDVAVRTSLGASRWRLIRSWLVDGLVLALPGIALGTWLGEALIRYGRASVPDGLIPMPEAGVLAPMVAAVIALAFVTSVLFGLAPIAAGLLRVSSSKFLRVTHGVAGLRRVRSQSVLIAGQVAVSLVLVISATWLSTSLWRALSRPVGFDASNLVMMTVRSAQPSTVQLDIARRMLDRLRQLDPGLGERVAVSSSLPGVFASVYVPSRIRPDQPQFSEQDRPGVARSAVSTGYFGVLGIRLLEGRYFVADDEAAPDRVIILGRSFAARWFPEGALGQTVTFARDDRREVVGIVEDVHAGRLAEDSTPQFYTPMNDPMLGAPSSYLLRTSRSVGMIRAEATAILREIDPTASLMVLTADQAMATPLTLQSVANKLTIGLALIALLLAVVNVYALSALAVVQRTREIGIRVALGASAGDAMRLVMRARVGGCRAGARCARDDVPGGAPVRAPTLRDANGRSMASGARVRSSRHDRCDRVLAARAAGSGDRSGDYLTSGIAS
jgi:putative ABC transport system permease protein